MHALTPETAAKSADIYCSTGKVRECGSLRHPCPVPGVPPPVPGVGLPSKPPPPQDQN